MQLSETVDFEFRRRYGLSPHDPRYLDATLEDVVVDTWAHRFVEHPEMRNEDVNEDFDADLAAFDAPPDPGDFDEAVADDRFGAAR